MSRASARALLGWLLLAFALVTALAAGGAAAVGTASPDSAAVDEAGAAAAGADGDDAQGLDAETAIRGADVYTSRCALCHGAAGQGGTTPSGVAAPALRGAHVALVDLVLRTGRMPPGDPDGQTRTGNPVHGERREALVAWLRANLDLTGEIPEVRPGRGDPARGQAVYAANCQQCHGSTGGGGVAGGGAFTPMLVDRDPLVIAEAIRMGPFQMPQFGDDVVSDRQIADTIAFLEEVSGEPGTPVGLVELNPVFAGGLVFVLSVAAIVSAMWLSGRVAMFPDAPGTPDAPDRPKARP